MARKKSNFNSKKKKVRAPSIKYQDKYDKLQTFNDGDFYKVEAIRDRKGPNNNPEYLVKWENWPEETNTWEPIANLLNVINQVETFEKERILGQDLTFLNKHKEKANSEDSSSLDTFYGCIHSDTPERIVKIKRGPKYSDNWNDLLCKVKWSLRRKNGVQPVDSWIANSDLKRSKPYARMLADYYEGLIYFCRESDDCSK